MINTKTIKEANKYERDGEIAKALFTLSTIAKNKSQDQLIEICEMNIKRLLLKSQKQATSTLEKLDSTPFYEHANNARTYATDHSVDAIYLPPIISLTTISSRIECVEKTVESILDQSLKPHSVNLYISDTPYLIDKGIPLNCPALKRIASSGANIYFTQNIGPYRKQIPIIFQLRSNNAHPRTPIITIDDDVIYPTDIISKLMNSINSIDAVIAHRGREIKLTGENIDLYKSFQTPSKKCSYKNIGTGKNGIAYRLGYFPEEPKDFIGQILAPTADDIWCKWVTAKYCIPTIILEPAAAYDPSLDFKEINPKDKNGLFHVYNARGTNDEAIANLEAYFSYRGGSVASLLKEWNHG
jgi:hypothetical protein